MKKLTIDDSNKYLNLDWQALPQYMLQLTVAESDIDQLGHVNNQRYLDWMLELANGHAISVGLGFENLKKLGKVMVAKHHAMDFKASCFSGDELILSTWIGDKVGCCQRLRHYQIIRLSDQKTVFSGQTEWACVSLKNYKPCRLPEEFITAYYYYSQ